MTFNHTLRRLCLILLAALTLGACSANNDHEQEGACFLSPRVSADVERQFFDLLTRQVFRRENCYHNDDIIDQCIITDEFHLKRDGSFLWDREDANLEGRWGLHGLDEESGRVLLKYHRSGRDLYTTAYFALDEDGLPVLSGLGVNELSQDVAGSTAGFDVPELALPETACQVIGVTWQRADRFSEGFSPTHSIVFKADGTYVSTSSSGEVVGEGSWSFEGDGQSGLVSGGGRFGVSIDVPEQLIGDGRLYFPSENIDDSVTRLGFRVGGTDPAYGGPRGIYLFEGSFPGDLVANEPVEISFQLTAERAGDEPVSSIEAVLTPLEQVADVNGDLMWAVDQDQTPQVLSRVMFDSSVLTTNGSTTTFSMNLNILPLSEKVSLTFIVAFDAEYGPAYDYQGYVLDLIPE